MTVVDGAMQQLQTGREFQMKNVNLWRLKSAIWSILPPRACGNVQERVLMRKAVDGLAANGAARYCGDVAICDLWRISFQNFPFLALRQIAADRKTFSQAVSANSRR